MSENPFVTTRRIQQGAQLTDVIELPGIRLVGIDSPLSGREFHFILPTVRFGSAPDNDVVISDPTVSRHHAVIRLTPRGILLEDQESTNGTFVGELRVTEVFLEPGTVFRLGRMRIRVQAEDEKLYALQSEDANLGEIVGISAGIRKVYGWIQAVAASTATVLIGGESGTGKELVARAIHELSGRKGPLVPFDCTTPQRELIASMLFGHLKGAFTGASDRRQGAFLSAQGGTLFLDEIGELPRELQSVLLRSLESRTIQPVGSDQLIPVDIRVVCATNRNLRQEVKEGRFREDLYFRLSVITLDLPPLRDRREDIPLLVEHLREKLGITARFDTGAMSRLAQMTWPGNIRELRNAVERLGILHGGRTITAADVENAGVGGEALPPVTSPPPARKGVTLDEIEQEGILRTYQDCDGNKKRTARVLGITVARLKRKLQRYGVIEGTEAESGDDDEDE